jgi:hypothetical protein
MRNAQPALHYPYKGVLYLATSPALELKGWLKFGETSQSIQARQAQHAGQLSDDKSEIFFCAASADRISAETLLKAYFREAGMNVAGRKELVKRDVALATSLLEKAVKLARVRSVPLLVPRTEGTPRLHSGNPAWAVLLEAPLSVGSKSMPLAVWLAQSLHDAGAQASLAKLGVRCVRWDRHLPEFELDHLDPQLSRHLSHHRIALTALRHPGGRFCAELSASM